MQQHTSAIAVDASPGTLVQLAAAAALGIVVLFAVGFAPMSELHNAAHDTRHSVVFPCH
ncbi:CbtB domain-containing protein [Arhodomonas sp. AD133]|uniref:CbtB domain-containing protein n=1 Tax=Arhodomonas sp. AD133 TaxID=3415009 RepID=UPI003EC10DCB